MRRRCNRLRNLAARRQERPKSPYHYPDLYNGSRRRERSLTRRAAVLARPTNLRSLITTMRQHSPQISKASSQRCDSTAHRPPKPHHNDTTDRCWRLSDERHEPFACGTAALFVAGKAALSVQSFSLRIVGVGTLNGPQDLGVKLSVCDLLGSVDRFW